MKNISILFALLLGLVLTFSACLEDDNGIPDPLNLPVLSLGEIQINEGDEDAIVEIPINLAGTNTTNVLVNFAVTNGTAFATFDYEVLTSGKIQFSGTETQKKIQIRIFGDNLQEVNEVFFIQIYNPSNATMDVDRLELTIVDDDDPSVGIEIPTSGYSTPLEYAGMTMVWADEFDDDTLNLNDWCFELGDGCPDLCGWGNEELQYYREDNTTLKNGNLIITAKPQVFGGRDYTSSRLITKGKQQFKYGRIDIRAALPEGQGLWPAIWMLGSNIDAVSWPACGEIDIMEMTGNLPDRILGTTHFGTSNADRQFHSAAKFLDEGKFIDEFHVFSLRWESNQIEFLLDDEVYHTMTPDDTDGLPYPFNKHFFFVLNVAVGGQLPGNPDQTTPFPQAMIVDYIRVFQ